MHYRLITVQHFVDGDLRCVTRIYVNDVIIAQLKTKASWELYRRFVNRWHSPERTMIGRISQPNVKSFCHTYIRAVRDERRKPEIAKRPMPSFCSTVELFAGSPR
ncbi:hypothetical protein Tcan_05950 [Toxocara canis]|uniref:Uncharacterized protein n=1 Tax=Toxocara canis TaxID=6265 RepID=A0A0B2VIL3_TOXCA|nr:hypothetical protein Tcan_05950 [Toxocara canis]